MSATEGTVADNATDALNILSDAGSFSLAEQDRTLPTSPHMSASYVNDGECDDAAVYADRQEPGPVNSWPAKFLGNQTRRHSERSMPTFLISFESSFVCN